VPVRFIEVACVMGDFSAEAAHHRWPTGLQVRMSGGFTREELSATVASKTLILCGGGYFLRFAASC
jgi:hypothetical protein